MLTKVALSCLAGSIIEAGSDTTRNQINLLLAAAAKYPTWVRTAQAQLDQVCGKAARLPTFEVSSFSVSSTPNHSNDYLPGD